MKMSAFFASELEFYLFDESYEIGRGEAAIATSRRPGAYIEDYHILQTTKEEGVMRAIRNGLQGAGIPVENSKGEWGPGQEEINVRYADALTMADRHVDPEERLQGDRLRCRARRSPSWRSGASTSPARSSHIHISLWDAAGKKPLFFDAKAEHGMSKLMRQLRRRAARACPRDHLVPGALHQLLQALPGRHLRADQGDLVAATTAPPASASAARAPRRIRIECRIGGADLNPYLAFAALLAAGLAGIEEELELEPPFVGDAYHGKQLREVPKTLREATDTLAKSKMLRAALRRRGGRPLCPHRRVGAVRIRPPDHRLGAEARVREVLKHEMLTPRRSARHASRRGRGRG